MAGAQGNIRSFIEKVHGSGRTAPSLLQDLTLYDPRQSANLRANVIADPPVTLHSQFLRDLLPPDSCRHEFHLKSKQSQLPRLDERPDPQTVWTVAAVCRKCRMHIHLKVDYTVRFESAPCPNADHPLHHFVRAEFQEELERSTWASRYPDSTDELYAYKCSSRTCSAVLVVRLSQPVLRPIDVRTLTDEALLRQRTEDAFRARGDHTEGMKHPAPIDVLMDLRAYIRNSWNASREAKFRTINLSNKRFIVRFGPGGAPCRDVLEYLGFVLVPDDSWRVPEPNVDDPLPLEDPFNIVLDNAENELLVLVHMRPQEEKQLVQDLPPLMPAEREFARTLGCQNYDKHPSSRTAVIPIEMRSYPFVALGVPEDAADDLVISAYRAQMSTDLQNAPMYLSNLRWIGERRQSDPIRTEVAMEASLGRYDSESLSQAYKAFQLQGREAIATDDDVIGSFAATLADSPSYEHELREYLRMIGKHRGSKKIQDTANNVIDNYEAALEFLDADPSTEDDHIQALFAVKTTENKALEEQAIKAVRLIAQHRQSRTLTSWIDSGFSSDPQQMEPAEGFQALQIPDRMADDEMILYQYQAACEQNPQSRDFYTRALTAIATSRGSTLLLEHLHNSSAAVSMPEGTSEQPVGLENIGNTCYLNSLLQFMFTVTELRHIVLNFDEFKMELDPEGMQQKRVGQRKVSLKEVQTAQKFVERLASLFRGMIETPQASIRPEQELARLTLETEAVVDKIRRRSTLRTDRPNLGHITSSPMQGVEETNNQQPDASDIDLLQSPTQVPDSSEMLPEAALPTQPPASDVTTEKTEDNNVAMVELNDNSSEATLVSKPDSEINLLSDTTIDEQRSIFDDKENLSPTKSDAQKPVEASKAVSDPLVPASSSKLNAQAGALMQTKAGQGEEQKEDPSNDAPSPAQPPPIEQPKYQPPPGKPPPVPPRKPAETATHTLEEYARQQDVTEVYDHFCSQLSRAIRPQSYDQFGEQHDELHDLFFGQQTTHSIGEKETSKPVEFSYIITRVYHRPVDVYAALDNEFDLQTRESGTKIYQSISRLPPVLSINLDRSFWDSTNKRSDKLNHHVDVPETIFMDRYLETTPDSDLMQRRQQTWELKKELANLMARRAVLEQDHGQARDKPSILEDARGALEHLSEVPDDTVSSPITVNSEIVATLGQYAEDLRIELEEIKSRTSDLQKIIKESFVDMRRHPYRLHAAFFHRGTPGSGHYYVYIYDHVRELWRKYNDDRVSEVTNLNEIFAKQEPREGWGPVPNPYLLVYVQADKIKELVETVRRDIIRPPAVVNQMSEMPPGSDVEMLEYANGHGNDFGYGEHRPSDYQDQTEALPQFPNLEAPAVAVDGIKEGKWDDSELMSHRRW